MLNLFEEIFRQLKKQRKRVNKVNQDIQTLKDNFTGFAADFSKFADDVTAKLGSLGSLSPEDKQAVTDITTAFGTMDATVKDLDTKINAA